MKADKPVFTKEPLELARALNALISEDEFRESVIAFALEHRARASSEARAALDREINQRVKVRGFADPRKAPNPTLKAPVARASRGSVALMGALLQVWVEGKKELAERVGAHMRSAGVHVPDDVFPQLRVHGFWSFDGWEGHARDLIPEGEEASTDEVRLMLCCITGRVPVLVEELRGVEDAWEQLPEASDGPPQAGGAQEPATSVLDGCLRQLRSLRPDAPEWGSIEGFLGEVDKLRKEKASERDAKAAKQAIKQARVEAQAALGKVKEDFVDELAYLELGEARGWVLGDAISQADCEGLAASLVGLGGLLAEHAAIRGSVARTAADEARRAEELKRCQAAIMELVQDLSPKLSSASGPSEPPGPGGPQHETKPKSPATPTTPEHDEPPRSAERPNSAEGAKPAASAQPEAQVKPQPRPSLRPPKHLGEDDPLLFSLLEQADIAGAYWVSRGIEAGGEQSAVPSWLLAALQGSRWLVRGQGDFTRDLQRIVTGHQLADDDICRLLAMAAALHPAITAPYAGMLDWLTPPRGMSALHELALIIREFAGLGLAVGLDDLAGASSDENRKAAVRVAAKKAEIWLRGATTRRLKYRVAADVWNRLVRPKGHVHGCLAPAAEDQRDKAHLVAAAIRDLREPDAFTDIVDRLSRELQGRKGGKIVGAARDQLLRGMDEAVRLAESWVRLVEAERAIADQTWRTEKILKLRNALGQHIPAAMAEVAETVRSEQDPVMGSVLNCVTLVLNDLARAIGDVALPRTEVGNPVWMGRQFDQVISLEDALCRRLILLPELDLNDDMSATREDLSRIVGALRSAGERDVERAVPLWIQKEDFRFIHLAIELLGDPPDGPILEQELDGLASKARARLRLRQGDTLAAIEQAVVDGLIADDERAMYTSDVDKATAGEILSFSRAHDALARVWKKIDEARRERLEDLRDKWQSTRGELRMQRVDQQVVDELAAFLEKRLETGDTRLVEEAIARLEEWRSVGGDLSTAWFREEQKPDVLSEFLAATPKIEAWFDERGGNNLTRLSDLIHDRATIAGLAFGALPARRRDEARAGIEAWRNLKMQEGAADATAIRSIGTLARLLGFEGSGAEDARIKHRDARGSWLHVQIPVMPSSLARPIPQFGSQLQGHLDVVCVWERPGAETIGSRLKELQFAAKGSLLLYLGRLTAKQRRDLGRVNRQADSPAVAVLDETLLVFLASLSDARLPAFLRCALPFAGLAPYTPFKAGDVPPEMFYGRVEMARELQKPEGTCLVYGGRQLGKSALLRHVMRSFSKPEDRRYAWVENMKLVFDPKAHRSTENIWLAIRKRLRDAQLMGAGGGQKTAAEAFEQVRDALMEDPTASVLVLCDEADDFLDADASGAFTEVMRLRDLMEKTDRRFKVVFAGLHNVQRFQGIPNQPLAHFGAPLCVGPLEPEAAVRLVTEPLEVLGFHFEAPSTPLLILSYTNYHPGLIQYFCQELLQALHQDVAGTMPPYGIRRATVEEVYRRQDVRDRIRERLDWTLALDRRYQAVAWSLSVDQLSEHDSFARAYPPRRVLEMIKDWWPTGFSGWGLGQMSGLLDEMCGLGVLVRDNEGRFRLRSPNLVRLMGQESDIEDKLLELAGSDPPRNFGADSHHAPLDEKGSRYSPLTYAQERLLAETRGGVALLLPNAALGGEDVLLEALRRVVPPGISAEESVFSEIPLHVMAEDLPTWMAHETRGKPGKWCLFYHKPLEPTGEDILSLLEQGINIARAASGRRWIRIVFLLDEKSAWTWWRLPEEKRNSLEAKLLGVVAPLRWDGEGIRMRLEQAQYLHSEKVVKEVSEATCGWQLLLDELLGRDGSKDAHNDDPREAARILGLGVREAGSKAWSEMRAALGIPLGDAPGRALDYLVKTDPGPIPLDLVEPEVVGLDREGFNSGLGYLICRQMVQVVDNDVVVDEVVRALVAEAG